MRLLLLLPFLRMLLLLLPLSCQQQWTGSGRHLLLDWLQPR
jgi:hypothetical protein